MRKPRNEKGRFIKTGKAKTERMRLTKEEKEIILKRRSENIGT